MLSPRYLDGLADEITEIYSQLESDILQDMARRIARLGKVTDATKWQAEMLRECGGLKGNISKILKKYDAKITDEVKRIYEDALKKNNETDGRIFEKMTGRKVSLSNEQMMLATIQKARSDLSRLTLTTARTSEEMFVQQANNAFMQVSSGAFDYDTAMKTAADNLADRGITAVQYENGKPVTRTIESAVRMNILTGVNQTASTVTLNNCSELDCDLVETSAHIGARPEHQAWQGQVFSLSGRSDKYPSFEVCGYGTATGICGINCRHSFYPFFEGEEEHYTQDDLDELAKGKVKYNGKEYSRYDAEQLQRKMERTIRHYKRRANTQDAMGVDSSKAKAKISDWQAKARDFTKQTGIKRDYNREYVGNGKNVVKREIEVGFSTGRSVGAMAKRFYVDTGTLSKSGLQNDMDWHIKENTYVSGVKVIATGTEIRDVKRLVESYPLPNGKLTNPNDWFKVRGTAIITDGNTERKVEIHWYQCKNIGKVEIKEKIWQL